MPPPTHSPRSLNNASAGRSYDTSIYPSHLEEIGQLLVGQLDKQVARRPDLFADRRIPECADIDLLR
jgi:hypothetical protein